MADGVAAKPAQDILQENVPTSEVSLSSSPERGASVGSRSDEDKYQTLKLLITSNADIERSTIYDVIHLGNTELFTLLEQRMEEAEAPGSGCGLWIQQLQESYVELKLKNVPLTPDIQMAVEQKLLDHQFFCEKSSVTMQEIVPTPEDVRQRVELALQLIDFLHVHYSTGNLDEQFLFLGRSVAQNLHILKRQMKGTYDILPWDEMLFCLVIFISCTSRMRESENFYRLVLDTKSILNHLTNFAENLSNVDLEKKEWQMKRIPTNRSKIIENVVKTKPTFETLYKDFEIIRNIYSLKRILKYVRLAMTVNVEEHGDAGALVVQRALQVMGECLKSTPDSPHVSADVHGALGCDAPRAARETLTGLRNLLSHAHTLADKLRLEADPGFFYSLQRDLRKIAVEINVILGKKRLETVTQFLNKIMKIDDLDDLTRLRKSLHHIDFAEIDELIKGTAEIDLTLDLLRQLEDELGDKTQEETLVLDEIKEIIESRETRNIHSLDHIRSFLEAFDNIKFNVDISTFQKDCQRLLTEIMKSRTSSVKLKNIVPLLTKISRKSSKKQVVQLCYRIFCVISFEETRIKRIEYLNENLQQKESIPQEEIDKTIREVFLEVQKRLVSDDSKIKIKKSLDSQIQVYENKQKLVNLCNGSVPDLESFVSLLKEMNFKPRNEKELVDKYKDGKFKECMSRLSIVVGDYESFARTLSKGHLLSYKYYNEALDAFFGALKLEKKLRSEVTSIIKDLKDERKQEISSYYDKRLTLLKQLFDCKNYLLDGGDQVRAAVEMLVLDLTEILDSNDLFVDSRLLYDEYSVVLIGKNLRNYLAHGDALVDVLPFDPTVAIACTAAKLIHEGKNLIAKTDTLIGRRTVFNLKRLKETRDKYQKIVIKQNDMFVAARGDNLELLQEAIDEGADVHGRDVSGGTGLHFAAKRDSVNAFAKLLSLNLNIATKDKYDRTPIHVAFANGSVQIVQLLEDAKLFDAEHDQIIDLLFLAAYNGHHLLIDKMLRDRSITEQGLRKSFYTAICMGHKKVIEVLLQSGLNLKAVTEESVPPLHWAAFCGQEEVVDLLLGNSAQVDGVDTRNMTAIFSAVTRSSTGSALVLLARGADVNASADDGTTPLLAALLEEQEECALALLEKSVHINVNCRDKLHNTALHYAADGLEKAVQVLLDKGAHVDEVNKSNHTALYIASKGGYDRIVTALITKGANVHYRTSKNKTALHAAAFYGHRYVVEVLLQNGARVEDQTNYGWTALHMAGKGGHKHVVEALLNYGADVDAEGKERQHPLHLAALNGHTEVARVLLKSGARLDATTKDGLTALHLAVLHDHESVVGLLLQLGADVRALADDHTTALHMAADLGNAAIARSLIESEASIDALTESNYTPLHFAVRKGHKSVVDLLLEMNADIDARGGDGKTPLVQAAMDGRNDIVTSLLDKQGCVEDHQQENAEALCSAVDRGYKDVVVLLITKGRVKVDYCNSLFPLLSAAVNGFGDIVSLLLDNNADIHARGVNGCGALHAAAENGHVDAVQILVSRQAEVNAVTDKRWTALHVAALSGHEDVARVLVENKADVEAKTVEGYTALYLAASKGFRGIVELLINSGANVDSFNGKNNWTALQVAAKNGHSDVLRVLLDNGAYIFAFSEDNFTPLHFAACYGHLEIVGIIIDRLMKNESDCALVNFINSPLHSGATPLHLAAGNGHKDIVILLLQRGANVNALNSKTNESALHRAAVNNHIDVVRTLLKEGIDVESINNSKARALDYAALKSDSAIVEELVRHGSDIFFKGPKKTTVLHSAVATGSVSCVNVLINLAKEKGEDSLESFVNSPDEDNWTALHLAAQNGHTEIVSILLQSAANVDAEDSDKWTALHVAARSGREEVFAQLLAAGADFRAQIGDRATALHLAAMSGFLNVVECLLSFVKVNKPEQLSAFINHKDADNSTALQLAMQSERTDIVQLLEDQEVAARGLLPAILCDKFFQDNKMS